MRTRSVWIKIAVLISLLVATYHIRCQYVFQHALSDLYISFDDFPQSYTTALNASRTNGDALIDLDYNGSFASPTIPRIIHFIYFADLYHLHDGSPTLPTTSRSRAPELCRKFNPSYEIRIWNETEAQSFIEEEYPWFLPTYNTYKHPIQRVDALKYFALYHYGGVYMDLDIACRRPLDPLLQYPAWFPEASPLGVNNDLMASMPRHPVLLDMTTALARRNWNLLFPYLTIFWSTGPQFASDILKAWWWKYGARNGGHDTASFRVLPQIFYSEEYTFFGHSPGGTWHGSDVAVVLWLVERPWVLACVFGSCLALTIGIMKGMGARRTRCKLTQAEDGILRSE
ncbi:hypothetical protein M3J09_010164 [Ascochyta lentis]